MTKKQEQLYALHRYFIWGNKMREHFDEKLRQHPRNKKEKNGLEIETILYMSYWYGGLYVVIEGWKELSLKDELIDELLRSKNVELLKRYRNATFHYQEEYWSKKFTDFMDSGRNCVKWIRKLNSEFGRYFLAEIDKVNKNL